MAYMNQISVWILPLLFAITLHEAAHAFAARALGDDTASKLGRLSLNPMKHIDPFGTVLLPGLLLLTGSPFLFGYAKPVPVRFRALHPQRAGMILVAAAGPLTNLALAIISAASFHLLAYLPSGPALWLAENFKNSILVNVFLAVFNLFPIPPLDGGRIAVGVLPQILARPLSRLEPYGVLLLLILLFVLPALGTRMDYDLGFASQAISFLSKTLVKAILHITRSG
jgi:Zn-dependent protease